jgi:aerobic carbon-monoxide dehydrogenase medium subunit
MKRFDYLKPKTVEECLTLLAKHGEKARVIAGGTDVMVMLKKNTIAPDVLISLQDIPGLNGIGFNGGLVLGPMVTHRTIEKSEIIRRRFSALADAVDDLGSVQIRNVATIGGNICTAAPSADTATPLLVLGTQVKIRSLEGERMIPLEMFFKGPGENTLKRGEIVEQLSIPEPLPHTGSAYYKLQRRLALDLPILGVSVLLSLDGDRIPRSQPLDSGSPGSPVLHRVEEDDFFCKDVRIALGVAAPVPMRAVKGEALLRGKRLRDQLLSEAANLASEEAQPRDSLRGEAWYRRDMVRVFVKRMALQSIERALQADEAVLPHTAQ